jgi:predicted enzyme related to lactoylglutathione lyase
VVVDGDDAAALHLDLGPERSPRRQEAPAGPRYCGRVASPIRLVEFPADEPARARRFWTGLLGVELEDRADGEGDGWQTGGDGPALGLHPRGTGPGDRVSLPYFSVSDMEATLNRVSELGGEVIHPGERWSVCRDSEGSPFGLVLDAPR